MFPADFCGFEQVQFFNSKLTAMYLLFIYQFNIYFNIFLHISYIYFYIIFLFYQFIYYLLSVSLLPKWPISRKRSFNEHHL